MLFCVCSGVVPILLCVGVYFSGCLVWASIKRGSASHECAGELDFNFYGFVNTYTLSTSRCVIAYLSSDMSTHGI